MDAVPNNYIGSILMDFPVQQQYCTGSQLQALEETVTNILQKKCGPLTKLLSSLVTPGLPSSGWITLFSGPCGLTTTMKTYPSRSQVTLSVEYDLQSFTGKPPMSFDDIQAVELELAEAFQTRKKTAAIPQIKRALDFDTYFTTSDLRLLEYDIKEMLFDEHSAFQHVQIGRSLNYGNVLILDGLVNLAEADLAYTESIMCRGSVDYGGKDVLILGGGDGALLHELRKENPAPKSITMIEIDDVVMKACKVHLRDACGSTLDNYIGKNYEIIVGDCIPFMVKCAEEGRTFDYIFGDLTDIPISSSESGSGGESGSAAGEIWEFFTKTLQLSFAILKEGGTYFTHANGISATESLDLFKTTIKGSLKHDVEIKTSMAFIPSFKEKWVFYQVNRK